MSFTICTYHPQKPAENICERCRRLICKDDKREYTRTRYYNDYYYNGPIQQIRIGNTTLAHEDIDAVSTASVYCIPCNTELRVMDALRSKINGIIIIAMLVLVNIPVLLLFISNNATFTYDSNGTPSTLNGIGVLLVKLIILFIVVIIDLAFVGRTSHRIRRTSRLAVMAKTDLQEFQTSIHSQYASNPPINPVDITKYSPCAYHPERASVTVCERCRRPICFEDKRVYRKPIYSQSSGIGNLNPVYGTGSTVNAPPGGSVINTFTYHDTHYVNCDYCIPCYNAQNEADYRFDPYTFYLRDHVPVFRSSIFTIIAIFMYFFFVLMIGLTALSARTIAVYILFLLFLSPIALLILYAYIDITYHRKIVQNLRNDTTKFNTNTTVSDVNTSLSSNSPNNIQQPFPTTSELHCFQCGTKLHLTDKFCPKCGDSTQDELRQLHTVLPVGR